MDVKGAVALKEMSAGTEYTLGYGANGATTCIPSQRTGRNPYAALRLKGVTMSFSTDHEQYRDKQEEAFNAQLLREPDGPECLEHGPDCKGQVEYRIPPDREDYAAFPRCEFHWDKRLDESEKIRELLSDVPPAWFDPAYAGEQWDED